MSHPKAIAEKLALCKKYMNKILPREPMHMPRYLRHATTRITPKKSLYLLIKTVHKGQVDTEGKAYILNLRTPWC